MHSYLLCKGDYTGIIIYMEYDLEGYSFSPKYDASRPYIKVNSVTIYEPKMIDSLLARKFQKKFDRLSQIIMRFLYDDDDASDEGDYMILLDEIARLKAVVELKYQRFLQVEEYKDYIHKLAFLDNQLRQKLAMISYQNNLNYEVSKGRSM